MPLVFSPNFLSCLSVRGLENHSAVHAPASVWQLEASVSVWHEDLHARAEGGETW